MDCWWIAGGVDAVVRTCGGELRWTGLRRRRCVLLQKMGEPARQTRRTGAGCVGCKSVGVLLFVGRCC